MVEEHLHIVEGDGERGQRAGVSQSAGSMMLGSKKHVELEKKLLRYVRIMKPDRQAPERIAET